MARLPRITPVNIPTHIIQRGNNRQVCFGSDADHSAYAGWLKEYSNSDEVDLHTWAMMTNHVHLLSTPRQEGAIPKMMQALGCCYVRYFNHLYNRSGTPWEGRYKSCPVQTERYLLETYRYIEFNPLSAGMVLAPGRYRWSGYQVNALGKRSELCTPHREHIALGRDPEDRRNKYCALFEYTFDTRLLEQIRSATNKGMVVGNDQFRRKIEVLTGRRVREKKRVRPVGWRKKMMES